MLSVAVLTGWLTQVGTANETGDFTSILVKATDVADADTLVTGVLC